MKREVSCRALGIVFDEAKRRNLKLEALTRGTGHKISHLSNIQEWIEWESYCTFMDNVARHLTDRDFVELGHRVADDKALRAIFLFARFISTPTALYKKIAAPGRNSSTNIFPCINPRLEEVAPDTIHLSLTIPEGFRLSQPFFKITQGNFESLPRLLGCGYAHVEMQEVARGQKYVIGLPAKATLKDRLKRAITLPARVITSHEEVDATLTELTRQYEELSAARVALERQSTQLEIANQIGLLVNAESDVQKTIDAVAEALVDIGKFIGAKVTVEPTESLSAAISSFAGQRNQEPLIRPLEIKKSTIGTLTVWFEQDDHLESLDLVEYVLPTLSLAIENALTYRALEDYRDNLESKVEERTLELRSAQEVREKIFANINHEIRTPLSLILMASEGLSDKNSDADILSRADRVQSIRASANELVTLVDDLLILASGQANKIENALQRCHVGQFAEEIVSNWQPLAKANGVALQATVEPIEGTVCPRAFRKILVNLLSNALKFTPEGGRIDVLVAKTDEGFELEVTDTGLGMDTETQKRVFDRFEGGAEPLHRSSRRGTGIGLSIVKELVEGHKGTISLESALNVGSTFRVRFPKVENTPVWQEQTSPSLSDPAPWVAAPSQEHYLNGAKHTVLVAEDDENLLAAIAVHLAKDFDVIVAADGEEALKLAREHHPDLLITDLDMPKLKGDELIRRFRDIVGSRLAPAIILSASSTIEDRLAGFDAGAIDFIVKPFTPSELTARVQAQLKLPTLAKKLNEADKVSTIGILSAGIAHNLRNPANVLVNAIPLIRKQLRGIPATEASDELLEAAEQSAERVAILASDLLGLDSRAAEGVARVSTDHVVEDALTLARKSWPTTEFKYISSHAGPVLCTRLPLVQALVILLENAAQASPPDCPVIISTSSQGDDVVFSVIDSGPGVPTELREKIFDAFFTTRGPQDGIGMGLSIARATADKMGGGLHLVQSTQETKFSLSVPTPQVS